MCGIGVQTRFGQKTNIQRFLSLAIKLQCFAVFVYYQGSSHILAALRFQQKIRKTPLLLVLRGPRAMNVDTA